VTKEALYKRGLTNYGFLPERNWVVKATFIPKGIHPPGDFKRCGFAKITLKNLAIVTNLFDD
jgi:hypothetical protein